ncbi:hypothetical protein QBC47DRAFT_356821 [Echria macrotheca]|uniref:Uncharacterized protein n=1 Tax=Echria macrotheca TaxID=438768 RepID=A0AAJ0F9B5_9PEZI|nr:hypothetical protein QBC47DRAFT_356821 [Echria macrotheca]
MPSKISRCRRKALLCKAPDDSILTTKRCGPCQMGIDATNPNGYVCTVKKDKAKKTCDRCLDLNLVCSNPEPLPKIKPNNWIATGRTHHPRLKCRECHKGNKACLLIPGDTKCYYCVKNGLDCIPRNQDDPKLVKVCGPCHDIPRSNPKKKSICVPSDKPNETRCDRCEKAGLKCDPPPIHRPGDSSKSKGSQKSKGSDPVESPTDWNQYEQGPATIVSSSGAPSEPFRFDDPSNQTSADDLTFHSNFDYGTNFDYDTYVQPGTTSAYTTQYAQQPSNYAYSQQSNCTGQPSVQYAPQVTQVAGWEQWPQLAPMICVYCQRNEAVTRDCYCEDCEDPSSRRW